MGSRDDKSIPLNFLRGFMICALLLVTLSSCGQDPSSAKPKETVADVQAAEEAPQTDSAEPRASSPDSPAQSDQGPEFAHYVDHDLMPVFDRWTGDFSAMADRRLIRALVPWSDTYYYLDGAVQRGIAYEAMSLFEKWLNQDLASKEIEVHVVILPVRRDLLLPYVAEGRGDVALGGITITEQRRGVVDFTDPASKPIEEWLVESSGAESVDGLDDLCGRKIHVRESSSYWESLQAVNQDFQARGLEPIDLQRVDEYLSTEDLLHMANAGAIPYTVADSEIVEYWSAVLPDIRIRRDIAVRQGARYGWAIRKDNPEFKKLLDRFLDDHRAGTLTGNVVINRYLKDTSRLHSIHDDEAEQRFDDVYEHFEEYARDYGFDALMMVAQGFQESRLDQSRRSSRGAIGIMQLLPSTAAAPEVGVPDITEAENNIFAGIKYMDWIRKTYLDDPALDGFNKTAMAFASYNAGPSRILGLRKKAEARGLNPNVWFENVELIAAEDIGSETVDYVSNIYKYYVAYKLSEQQPGTD